MASIASTPYIPESITVHLGAPDAAAENVTVSFPDYIKNVASSEVYPTWEEAALRANILAQISFALNKVFLEYYPSRGYNFDITSSTAYDQKFIRGRNYFSNIEDLVDELFRTYIRRQGNIEPLAASFCNGTTVTCAGMSQWGSQALAQEGYSSLDILRRYYGNNIELVPNTPVQGIERSYPGRPLRLGSAGENVVTIQTALNRVGQNYPAIPKISPVDGLFGTATESAVRKFQEIFSLTADGVVGEATWYMLLLVYAAVLKLSELVSEGQKYVDTSFSHPEVLSLEESGEKVSQLQYMLNTLSEFIPELPAVTQDGRYGVATRNAVIAYQRFAGLSPSGITGVATWDSIYNRFSGVTGAVLDNPSLFPTEGADGAISTIADVQRSLQQVSPVFAAVSPPRVTGVLDRTTTRALTAVQTYLHLRTTGQPDLTTRRHLQSISGAQASAKSVRHRQYPGFPLTVGASDAERIPRKEVQRL